MNGHVIRPGPHWDSSCAYEKVENFWKKIKGSWPKKTTLTGGPQKSIPNVIPRLQKKIGPNTFLIFEIVFFPDFCNWCRDQLGTSWGPVGNQLGTSWEPVGNQLGTSWEPVEKI